MEAESLYARAQGFLDTKLCRELEPLEEVLPRLKEALLTVIDNILTRVQNHYKKVD